MSKARLVITAVVVEGRTQSEVARSYGVSKGWVSRLLARYRIEGEAAFQPRSRRPSTSPKATPTAVIDLVIRTRRQLTEAGLDAGAETIAWHLRHHHQLSVSRATIHRILVRHGLVVPQPAKRPKSSYLRFEAELPNECWQSDFTHYRLSRPDGSPAAEVEIISWLDDHSRYALHVTAHPRISGPIVLASFRLAASQHGFPASTLTDNAMVYTARFAGGRGGRTALESELRQFNIIQKNSRPNHPTTCGKIERFQQTMKKWLRAQPSQPATITDLQTLLDSFVAEYNQRRPHRSLPRQATPATAYQTRPKATPAADRTRDHHNRVRQDRVDDTGVVTLRINGKLHHIGIGRTHARTHVLLLVHDLQVRIVDAATGQLYRELLIDPNRNYQPTGKPPGPTPQPK